MTTYTTPIVQTAIARILVFRKSSKQIAFFWLVVGLVACSSANPSGSGSQKKVRIAVGEIKEITLPNRGDEKSELVGTSDNQEVVEVSRQQLAPAVDTLKHNNTRSTIFQIKGITAGTANVVFTTKPLNQAGNGQTVRTYVVQVSAK
jgi:hypothetical protein